MKENIIKARRQALGLNPENVARAADIKPEAYKSLEEGRADPNRFYLHQIVLLAHLLKITPNEIAEVIAG